MPPPRRRATWPWLVGVIAAAGILVLGGATFAVWSSWSGRTASTSAQASAPAPGATTAPGTSAPEAPDSSSAGAAPSTSAGGATPGPSGSGGVDAATRSWLAATNAYCRTTTDPAIKKASSLTSTDLAAYLRRIAAVNRDLDVVLRKSPPSSLRTQVEQVAANWDRMAALYDQAATALAKNDRSGAARLATQGDAANQAGNDLATRIGLQDCAQAGAIGGTATASDPGPMV